MQITRALLAGTASALAPLRSVAAEAKRVHVRGDPELQHFDYAVIRVHTDAGIVAANRACRSDPAWNTRCGRDRTDSQPAVASPSFGRRGYGRRFVRDAVGPDFEIMLDRTPSGLDGYRIIRRRSKSAAHSRTTTPTGSKSLSTVTIFSGPRAWRPRSIF